MILIIFTRLYTNNLKKEIFNVKKFLYHKLKSDPPKNYIYPIDNPDLKDYEGNMQDRVYTMKSLKELYDFPMYAQPFIMTEEHYKSMNRRLDENTNDVTATKLDDSFSSKFINKLVKINESITEDQLK